MNPKPPASNVAPTVHVVEDDASLRSALKDLFNSVGIETCTYASAGDFLHAKICDNPGCIVVDIRLPDMNGLDFYSQLPQLGIILPVVIMTAHGDVPTSVRAIKQGAMDFLLKPFRDQDMLDAVTGAIARDRQRRAIDDKTSDVMQRFETLSAREQQVMMLVTAGNMNKQVAAGLGISEVTAKIHRGAAMRKMGARTLPDLVRLADTIRLKKTQSK
jgi:FixJ family two-component response regulator